jgi:anaerobic selenocysteine-containing dehydrogenase
VYYTLAVIGKAGIGTPHMDGNTRWCTVTAAAALQETFGSDGQPSSYTDIDACDAVFLFGHNVAETEGTLGDSYRVVAAGHRADADVHYACLRFAADCAEHAEALRPVLTRYDARGSPSPSACTRRG